MFTHMIKEIRKDVTTVEQGIVLHQVNAMGVMGSGVALAIKDKWPVVYEKYIEYWKEFKDMRWRLMGSAQRVEVDSNITVVNLFGQYDFGYDGQRRTEYGSLGSAFINLSCDLFQTMKERNTIYIPYKMGCDRGGGDWNIVYDMIKTLIDNDERTIYICRL